MGKSLEFDERRDYHSLEDAVDALMAETADTLRGINPEVLIEFRQRYVGPAIRKYGNMLRVKDCPNDAIRNRCMGNRMEEGVIKGPIDEIKVSLSGMVQIG
jgi:alpha-galactosidase